MSPQLPVYNLSDLPDSADVPAGRYRAKLMTCTKKKSREQHIPMLEWKWKIISGKAAKLTILSWTMLDDNPRSLANFKQHMLALGRKNKSGGNTDDLLGRLVTLVVARREYIDRKGVERTASNIIAILPKDAPLKVDKEDGIEGDEESTEEEGEETSEDGDESSDKESGDEESADEEDAEEKPAKKKKPVEDEAPFDKGLVRAAEKDWNAMDGDDRKQQAVGAGLTGKFKSRDWDELTDEEKSAMYELHTKPAKPAKKHKKSEDEEEDLPF